MRRATRLVVAGALAAATLLATPATTGAQPQHRRLLVTRLKGVHNARQVISVNGGMVG